MQRLNKSKYHILVPKLVWTFFVLMLTLQLHSQPYVDPLQVRFMRAGETKNPVATPFSHLFIGSELGIKSKSGFTLIFTPYYEQWSLDSAETQEIYPTVKSIAFPVGAIIPFHESKWSLMLLPFIKTNGEELFAENTLQYGGVILFNHQRRPQQKFKFGVYMNQEFFGLYVMPLLGVDWRLNDRDNIFGVLPGFLTVEHQINENFYSGIRFRAPVSSYRLTSGEYLRLDDNQISLFIDYYLARHFCITLEPGFGILRRVRTGINKDDYLTDEHWGDGPFIKLSAAYRIRLEEKQ